MCTRCLSVSFRFGLRLFHFTKKSFIKVFCVCVFRFSFFGVFRLSYGGCVSLSLSALCVNVRFEFFFCRVPFECCSAKLLSRVAAYACVFAIAMYTALHIVYLCLRYSKIVFDSLQFVFSVCAQKMHSGPQQVINLPYVCLRA